MKIKNQVVMTVEYQGDDEKKRCYSLSMPAGCPLGEAQDATYSFLMKLNQAAQEQIEKLKTEVEAAKEKEEAAVDEK